MADHIQRPRHTPSPAAALVVQHHHFPLRRIADASKQRRQLLDGRQPSRRWRLASHQLAGFHVYRTGDMGGNEYLARGYLRDQRAGQFCVELLGRNERGRHGAIITAQHVE